MYPVLWDLNLGRFGHFTLGTYGLFYAIAFLAAVRLGMAYARMAVLDGALLVVDGACLSMRTVAVAIPLWLPATSVAPGTRLNSSRVIVKVQDWIGAHPESAFSPATRPTNTPT